jgi:hypothetical protein
LRWGKIPKSVVEFKLSVMYEVKTPYSFANIHHSIHSHLLAIGKILKFPLTGRGDHTL